MTNRIKTAILLSLAVWSLVGLAQGQRPNILFILVDDMGWSDLASYGHQIHETPHTDRLASEGMRFTDAYAPAPVCGPSRCAIMTGKFPSRTGFTDNYITLKGKKTKTFMPLEEFTLGEAFQAGGYQTGYAGKWHLQGLTTSRLPNRQGFDVALGSDRGPGRKFFTPYNMGDLTDGPEGEYLPDRLTNEAIRMMDDFSKKEQPWLMYLSFYVVHSPFIAKKEKIEKYTEKAKQANIELNTKYAAMVESMDENVGRLLQWLDEKNLRKDTVIVFTSDNGGFHQATHNRPLRSYKGHLYDGGIREPLIIDWPGVTKAGSVSATPVHGTDFYPTLLEMAGLPLRPEQHRDGVSFAPTLKGDESFDRSPMIWHYHDQLPDNRPYSEPGSAIRIGDWKYLQFYEDGRRELYNLRDDIGETENLLESMPEKAAELKAALDAALIEHGAVIPASGKNGPPKKTRTTPVAAAKTVYKEGTVLIDFGNPVKAHTERVAYNNIGAKGLLESYAAEAMNLNDTSGGPAAWTLRLEGNASPAISDARVRLDFKPGMLEAVDEAPAVIEGIYSLNTWKDGIRIEGGEVTLAFGNLEASKTYDLLFFGARAKDSQKQTWSIVSGSGGNAKKNFSHRSTSTDTAIHWKGIKPDDSGVIRVKLKVGGEYGALNFAAISEAAQ